ncbi:hypothetical protein DYB32_008933 [Aphanomyces invadans]|uniref:Uncharacterized protein n=1 Tax=Aphanomyces invadans TaxID=157072 RepID=A0A3R6WG20_9STRA|nr:hypothetical protein DYB32_008933 [Aphanomyces invadans]
MPLKAKLILPTGVGAPSSFHLDMASSVQGLQPAASNNANIITRHTRKAQSPEASTPCKAKVHDGGKVPATRPTEATAVSSLPKVPPLHEYLHYLLEHMKWDSDATKSKLKQLMHFDTLERDSLHMTLGHCLNEIDRLHCVLKKVDTTVDSNQADEGADARPEDETNNEPEEDKPKVPLRGANTHDSPWLIRDLPGKVSMSPGKLGNVANQLVLVKAKKPKQSPAGKLPSATAANHQRWAIKIARKFKPLNLSLFTFHPAAAAIPPPVLELGPQQNAMMLRQLRYVKGVMHELPWAKSRLRDMLSQYTQKDLSKELLFPQLSHLSTQVQDELTSKSQAQKSLLETKSKLTVTLQLAKCVINDLHILKFGRRGKPHETKLFYDECHPCMLYWQSKQGERSNAYLPLHGVKAIHIGMETAVLKKAAKKTPSLDADCFLSLVTDDRTLDLKLKNVLQRDWLLKSLREVVDYAIQYRANYSAKKTLNLTPRLRRM